MAPAAALAAAKVERIVAKDAGWVRRQVVNVLFLFLHNRADQPIVQVELSAAEQSFP